MQRLRSLSENRDEPRRISLASELVRSKLYKLEGNGPYVYNGVDEGDFVFVHAETGQQRLVTQLEMNKLLSSNAVLQMANDLSLAEVSVPDFPHLDRFTMNMFGSRTADLWDRTGVETTFSRTELLQLDDLCRENDLYDIPTPGERDYMRLLEHPNWQLFKKYIQFQSPDTQLPEEFA